jgi:serine/threonine protein kinase
MGDVYQAHDGILGRDVAVKILPEGFARDPERIARFEREARLLASLNHPNIATIHGLEHSDSIHFLVMELVPGETLEQLVTAGPFPLKEALTVCRQVAEALEAAHRSGIVHRDIKSSNIKLTPEGRVKVLDFGLAKAVGGDFEGKDVSQLPTKGAARTKDGRILGTPSYMSPEQMRGKNVDRRADLWTFGCVLYELLTGRKTFSGATTSDTIAAVLHTEPAWEALPQDTPANTSACCCGGAWKRIRTARLQDAGDARIEIEDALSGLEHPAEAEPIGTVPVAPQEMADSRSCIPARANRVAGRRGLFCRS